MKQTTITSFIPSILLLMMVLGTSCQDDPCETVDCGPYGNCITLSDEANCRCDDGFEQDASGQCRIFSITQYPAAYTAFETCTSKLTNATDTLSYPMDISLFSTQEINLINLGNHLCTNGSLTLRALVDGNDFILQSGTYCQDVTNQSEYTISGNGGISEEGISFEYDVTYSQFGTVTLNASCRVTLSAQ